MRRLSKRPPGALFSTAQLRVGPLYLVSPCPGDQLLTYLRVTADSFTLLHEGEYQEIRGLNGWNKNRWEEVRLLTIKLNLIGPGMSLKNDINDAFVFQKMDHAEPYIGWCLDNPDVQWVERGFLKYSTYAAPLFDDVDGTFKRPSYD